MSRTRLYALEDPEDGVSRRDEGGVATEWVTGGDATAADGESRLVPRGQAGEEGRMALCSLEGLVA